MVGDPCSDSVGTKGGIVFEIGYRRGIGQRREEGGGRMRCKEKEGDRRRESTCV